MKRIDTDIQTKEIIYGMIRFHADNIQDISILDIDEEKGEIMDYILNALGFEHVSPDHGIESADKDMDNETLSSSATSPKSLMQHTQEQVVDIEDIQREENEVQTPNIHMFNNNNSNLIPLQSPYQCQVPSQHMIDPSISYYIQTLQQQLAHYTMAYQQLQDLHYRQSQTQSYSNPQNQAQTQEQNEYEQERQVQDELINSKNEELLSMKEKFDELKISHDDLEMKHKCLQKEMIEHLLKDEKNDENGAFCSECQELRDKSDFITDQWEKESKRKCKFCMNDDDKDMIIRDLKTRNGAINEELKELTANHRKLQIKHNELCHIKNEIERRYCEMINKCDYKLWDPMDVLNWIINLNRKKYGKYRDILTKNIIIEKVDGKSLERIYPNDLHRLGLDEIQDGVDVYNAIRDLVDKNHSLY